MPGTLGTIRYTHYGHGKVNAGQTWMVGLLYEKEIGSGLQTEVFGWTKQTISNEALVLPGYGSKTDTQSIVRCCLRGP